MTRWRRDSVQICVTQPNQLVKIESTRRLTDASSEFLAAKAAIDDALSLGDPYVLVTVSRRIVAATQEIIAAGKALREEMALQPEDGEEDLPDDDEVDDNLRKWSDEIATKSTLLSVRLAECKNVHSLLRSP